MNLINVEDKIIEIRGQKILLDCDISRIYGVETKRVNEAVKNNIDKFPKGYILELSKCEWDGLKSKFSSSNKGGKVKLPNAFTEKGLYMLATILKSPHAVQTTIAIIETFAKLRQLSRNIDNLSLVQNENEKKKLMKKSAEIFTDIFNTENKSESETSFEVNFAVLKFKHSVKKN